MKRVKKVWFFNQKRRVREVVRQIAEGLADGTIVLDPPLVPDPLMPRDEREALPQEDAQDADGPRTSVDDRIVVEPLETPGSTAGGILLLDTAKLKPQRGRVLAVGQGKLLDNGKRAALAIAEGDEVLYGKYAGADAMLGAKEVKILHESDIVAKILK